MRAFYEARGELLGSQDFGLDFELIDMSVVYDRVFVHTPRQNICLVGEAPGENEAKHGVPFCGQAGKNLSELIALSGIPRERFCITNGFCFRTFKDGARGKINRTPNTPELKAGARLLEMELKLLEPKMIILLGLSAMKAFSYISDESMLGRLKTLPRSQITQSSSDILGYEIILAHTYHPSPLVYNQSAKKQSLREFFLEVVDAI